MYSINIICIILIYFFTYLLNTYLFAAREKISNFEKMLWTIKELGHPCITHFLNMNTHTPTCVCVCVSVCVRARGRESFLQKHSHFLPKNIILIIQYTNLIIISNK